MKTQILVVQTSIISSDFCCLHKPRITGQMWILPSDLATNPGGSKKYLEIYHKLSFHFFFCHELTIAICSGTLSTSQEKREDLLFIQNQLCPAPVSEKLYLGLWFLHSMTTVNFKKTPTRIG